MAKRRPQTLGWPVLIASALALWCVLGSSAVWAQTELPPGPGAVYELDIDEEKPVVPYLQRVVEFMWVEHGQVWTDRFYARLYPRHPMVGRNSRINLRIRRYRNGLQRGKAAPLKVEALVRRTDGSGSANYAVEQPGTSVSFDHVFRRAGSYVVSVVTYYSETEKYTVALRFEVRHAPPTEDNDADDTKKKR